MAFFRHETAIVESSSVGDGTRVGAFVHILPGARIGRDCHICDHTFIDNDVIIGDRVTIKPGVQLWDGLRVEDDVFIGPNATFVSDPAPRGARFQRSPTTLLKSGASIGTNATVLPGVTIGERAVVAAAAVITHDVPRHAIVTGNPGNIVDYVDVSLPSPPTEAEPVTVEGVVVHRLPFIEDLRGNLTFAEVARHVPFDVKRYFVVVDVPNEQVRGEHAHRAQHQFLVCVAGRCSVLADDGARRQEFLLDAPNIGLYIPPMTWALQYKYSRDGVLLVLSSAPYDPADYIRDYQEFLALKRRAATAR